MFGFSKKERIEREIKRIRSIISQFEYQLNFIRELRASFIEEKSALSLSNSLVLLIDQILKVRWDLFTVENLTAEGYKLNPTFATNEAHNFELHVDSDTNNRGFIPALKYTRNLIASTTPRLALYSDTIKRTLKYKDLLGHERAIDDYLNTVSNLENLLIGIIKDLSDALGGNNALLCGLIITKSARTRLSTLKRWATGLALTGTLATAGFKAAPQTARSEIVNVVKRPIQNITIGALGVFSIASLQEKVDEINNKIKRKEKLSDEEIDFLRALYQTVATGGSFSGMPTASRLLDHYVSGEGTDIEIDPEVYTSCPAVQDAMRRMKDYIVQGIRKGKLSSRGRINSTDEAVRRALGGRSRDNDYQNSGILKTGFIKSGVADSRTTFYANRRFPLTASYTMQGGNLVINWMVEDVYDFRDKGNMSTLIPMPGGTLRLWDRISCAIATTAEGSRSLTPFAREFVSRAMWTTGHQVESTQVLASNIGR